MNFWSKGLGNRTIDLHLGKGAAHPGAERLFVAGKAEAPVSWDYIVALRADDLVDLFAVLRDPAMADFVYRSPDRWRLLAGMITGGLALGYLVAVAAVRLALGKSVTRELVELQLPPPTQKKSKRAVRGRLGSRRPAGVHSNPSGSENGPVKTRRRP